MPDFDVLMFLELRNRTSRSNGLRKKVHDKCKNCDAMESNTSLNDLSTRLREHSRYAMLSSLSALPVAVLRILDVYIVEL